MGYDATYALSQLIAAQQKNPTGQRTGHDATTALSAVIPQAQMPADGRAPFTLPNMASTVAAPASHLASVAPVVVTAAVTQLQTEKPKGKDK